MLYGSWPWALAAHQMSRRRSPRRRLIKSGSTTFRKASKGWWSRKNELSVVTKASTICRCNPLSGWPRNWASSSPIEVNFRCRRRGASRVSTRYCLPSSRAMALCSRSRRRTSSKSWSVMKSTPAAATAARLSLRRSPRLPDATENLVAHQGDWQHPVGQPRTGDVTGHAPDDGGGLVLGQDLSAGFVDRFAAAQAVLTHPGQDHSQGVAPVGLGHRAKQDVGGRSAGVFGGVLMHQRADLEPVPLDHHVVISGRDVRVSWLKHAVRTALLDRDGILGGESLGQQPGEHRRHVLHDYDWHGK